MKSIKKEIVFIILFFSTFFMFSQEQQSDYLKTKVPFSIYSSAKLSTDLNSSLNINNRLNLTSYKFLILDKRSIEEGYFTIPFYNIGLSPSEYIYDSYNQIYNNLQLQKAFFKVSDLYKVRSKNPL